MPLNIHLHKYELYIICLINLIYKMYNYIFLFLYIWGLFAMSIVQLIQQCLAVNRKPKNLVVIQSHKAECLNWSSVDAGIPKK